MNKKWYFRIRYVKLGGHYHCRVFSKQTPNGTYAQLGPLCLCEDEWEQFRSQLEGAGFEFKPEDE